MRSGYVVAALAAATIATLAVTVGSSGSGSSHRVGFDVANAANLIPGLQVRAAGQRVGTITAVSVREGGRGARITLELSDGRVWPLPADTFVRVRYGGTIAANGRYVELHRGTAKGTPIPDGGRIRRVELPVEFDELFNTFGPRTRQSLRSTVDAAGRTLDAAGEPLHRALDSAPPAVHQFAGALVDLGDTHVALDTLVRSTDHVLAATERADPGLGPLLTDAATTLTAVSRQADAVKRTLDQTPETLQDTRTTLTRVDRTLTAATTLTGKLAPGVDQLRRIIPPLNGTLRTVRDVAPSARRALATTRRAAPDLVRLLDDTRALTPNLTSTLDQATTQLSCLRPYAPEIAGFASTWSGFVANGDKKDKYARLFNAVYPFPNDTPLTVPQLSKLMPGPFQAWGFPRAPGANVGQPWYQPNCGITADGADPSKDPEAINFDLFSKNLLEVAP
jgi:ABC-type transporter Mla subunit MlaD